MAQQILALVDDLFFYSKIRQAARQVGRELKPADPATLGVSVGEVRPSSVLVELGPGVEQRLAAVRAMKSDPALAGIRVVAFGSHVETSVLDAARQAGCDEVYSRGEFSSRLAEILAS